MQFSMPTSQWNFFLKAKQPTFGAPNVMHFIFLSSFINVSSSGISSCPKSGSSLNFNERSKAQRTARAPPSECPVVTTVSIVGMCLRISLRRGIICFCTAWIRNHNFLLRKRLLMKKARFVRNLILQFKSYFNYNHPCIVC